MVEEMDRKRALRAGDVAGTEILIRAPPVDLAPGGEKAEAKDETERESIRCF